ncbi:hypothetical protein DFH28DRAFT_1125259 [Melampsora americana]|nr:hypothetical protein DFH28DRAFT_1125259 [Melampsora americana]
MKLNSCWETSDHIGGDPEEANGRNPMPPSNTSMPAPCHLPFDRLFPEINPLSSNQSNQSQIPLLFKNNLTFDRTKMSSLSFVSFDQANHNDHFLQVTSGPTMGQWRCKLSTARTFKDRARHSKLLTHIDRVRLALQRASASRTAVLTPGLQEQIAITDGDPSTINPEAGSPRQSSASDPDNRPIFNEDDKMASFSDEMASLYDPKNNTDLDIPESRPSSVDIEEFLALSDDESATSPIEEDKCMSSAVESWLPWYPLRKKEHAAALLMMGTGRNLMSTAEYNCIRSIMKLVLKVELPDLERMSPLGNPCFTISVCDVISQELGNPEVAPHIEFLPENDEGVVVI